MNKHTKPTLKKLETIFKELDFILRYEKGSFNSGYCLVENSKVVVVNKFFDTDGRVAILLEILNRIMGDEEILSDKSKSFYRNLMKNSEFVIAETNKVDLKIIEL